jgi:hypothetical protein
MEDWEEYLVQVSDLVEKREKYQKVLGQVSFTISERYGAEALDRFANELLETSGYKVSPTTLRSYRWVWEKTKDLNLPEDMPYRIYREIAGTKDPASWAERIIKEGLSAPDAIRQIRLEKGLDSDKKETICPHCGGVVNV